MHAVVQGCPCCCCCEESCLVGELDAEVQVDLVLLAHVVGHLGEVAGAPCKAEWDRLVVAKQQR